MADMEEVLERQEREMRERRRRRAASKRAQRELDDQLVIAVALLDEENKNRNLMEDYFIPTFLYSDFHFRGRYRMQKNLFNKIMHDICNYDEYFVQKRNCLGVLGLLPEQKFTTFIRMLAYGASAIKWMRLAGWGSPLLWRVWLDFVMQSKLSTPGTTRADLRPRDPQRLLRKPNREDFRA
ncbi:unnamed protein product [Prunus brigantina]